MYMYDVLVKIKKKKSDPANLPTFQLVFGLYMYAYSVLCAQSQLNRGTMVRLCSIL